MEIEGAATKMKYMRLIQRMDLVELQYHAEQAKKRGK